MLRLASALWNWMSGLIYVTILLFLHSSLYICCSKDRRQNRCQKQEKTSQLDRVGPHGDIVCKDSWTSKTSLTEDEINKEKITDDARSGLVVVSQSTLNKGEQFGECETQRTESIAKDVDEEDITLEFDHKQKQAVIESLHRFLDISKTSKVPLQVRCNTNAHNIIFRIRKVKR